MLQKVVVVDNRLPKNYLTRFTVSFEQKGGNVVQPHIDYDVTITKDGKLVFQASALGGGIIKGTSKTAHPNHPLPVLLRYLIRFKNKVITE